MKNAPYPLGEPFVFGKEHMQRFGLPQCPWTGPKFELPIRGLILCRILPPKKMRKPTNAQQPYPPFLGYRAANGNLVFPLCAKCSDIMNRKKCRHNDTKRSWIGAFNHSEIILALQLGYSVLDVFEVSFWEERNHFFSKNSVGTGLNPNGPMDRWRKIYFANTSIVCSK